jgi:nicotinamidase-related amidase
MQEFRGIQIAQSWEENVTPQHTALIVYDMQEGITPQIANGQEITRKVARVLSAARNAGVRVFFTRHMSLPTELMGSFQYRTAMAWQRLDAPKK